MNHIGTKTLETQRLILRRYTLDDARAYACVDSPAGNVVWEPPFSQEQTAEVKGVINRYKNPGYYRWAIALKDSGAVVGGILIVKSDEKMLSCEIAYVINPKYRNRGYASEALRRVLVFLLTEVEYNRVQAGHLADNPASGRVMQKAGMKYEGTLRQDNRNREGVLTDSMIYGLLREDINE